MEPLVEVARQSVDDWRHGADDPLVGASTVEVGLCEPDGQVLLLLHSGRRRPEEHHTVVLVVDEVARPVRVFDVDTIRVFPRRVVLALVPAVGQEDLVPAVPLVRAERVVALGPGSVVFDVDRLVRRFSQPVRRLVVVVETEGARPEQTQCHVEREVLVPVGVRTVHVVQDGAAIDAVLVGGDISGRRQVVVE